jgi:alpha-beta hydrolase superfamily lysophospholipase
VKILYLHGWNSMVGGVKPTYLKSHGHHVIETALDHEDFQAALNAAQEAFDQHQPEVVVGSSRGGAVAVNLHSGSARIVLICPAWKKWGTAKTVKPGTQILHSRADDVVPFTDSVELTTKSGLPGSALIEVGQDHRLADVEPLEALLRAVNSRRESP